MTLQIIYPKIFFNKNISMSMLIINISYLLCVPEMTWLNKQITNKV